MEAKMSSNIVECSFNLFNEGREYTGNHRKYILENAQKICRAPATAERIKLREALGYYGHGRRILAKKMNLSEVEAVEMPDGSKVIVSNVPSNVTTEFVVESDGTVRHKQEILDTETGRIVAELNKSRVGGFSWACPGNDGGALGATRLTGFSGFDYVLSPGFAMNRGYVLESAVDQDQILESITAATGMDDKRAEDMLRGWVASSHFRACELEERLETAELYESALLDKLTGKEVELKDLSREKQIAAEQLEAERKHRKQLVDFIVESSPFFIPEDVQHAMMENDFDRAQGIFESAKRVDFGQFPLKHGDKNPEVDGNLPRYGSPSAGWDV
jgi:hypothetical protein